MRKHSRINLYIRTHADLVERGKLDAASQGKPLSRLVEVHLLKLIEEDEEYKQAEKGAQRSAEVLHR